MLTNLVKPISSFYWVVYMSSPLYTAFLWAWACHDCLINKHKEACFPPFLSWVWVSWIDWFFLVLPIVERMILPCLWGSSSGWEMARFCKKWLQREMCNAKGWIFPEQVLTLCLAALGERKWQGKQRQREGGGKEKGIASLFVCLDIEKKGEKKVLFTGLVCWKNKIKSLSYILIWLICLYVRNFLEWSTRVQGAWRYF